MPDETDASLKEIKECMGLLKDAKPEERSSLYVKMGDVYNNAGKMAKALVCYRQAVDAGLQEPADVEKVARHLMNSGDLELAEKLVARTADKATEPIDKARMKLVKAYLDWHTSRFEDGLKNSEAALIMLETLNGPEPELTRLKGNACSVMGVMLADIGEATRSKEMTEKALEHYKKAKDLKGMARMYNNLGMTCLEEGDLDKALAMFRDGLDIHKDLTTDYGGGTIYSNIGRIQMIMGDFKEAEKNFKECLKECKAAAYMRSVHLAQRYLAEMYIHKRELVKARNWAEQALKGYKEITDSPRVGESLCTLAHVHHAEGDLKGALALAEQALPIAAKHRSIEVSSVAHRTIGSILRDMGKLDDAERNLRLAIDEAGKMKDAGEGIKAKTELAVVLKKKGDTAGARVLAKEVRAFYSKWNSGHMMRHLDENGL